ncbi:MAG: thiol:disulfide interchange protein DsbG [Francisellaceae bacterium]|jgi:thiol:disulfide interchange protein DsbG
MIKKYFLLTTSTVLLSVSASLFAGNDSKAKANTSGVNLIKSLTNNQAKVSESFSTPIGLNGYVIEPVENGGQKQVVFTQGDKYLIIGNVVTADGKNLTKEYTQEYITSKVAKESYKEISNLNWVSEGSDDAKHKMYVIFDPNCIYCHLFYKEVNKLGLIKDKKLQIRWLPVGFLKPSSAGIAAAMLNAISPIQAIVQDENGFNNAKEQSGLKPLDAQSDNPKVKEDFAKITKNTAFFSKYGFGGTPTLIFKKSNGEYEYIAGFVKDKQLVELVNSLNGRW